MPDPSSSSIRVLLIEDNEIDSTFVSRLMSANPEQQIEVDCVCRLSEAIERLQSSDYDVALLDLMLPDADGLESFDQIRALDARLPVVVLTGLDDEDLALLAIESGAQDFMAKGHITGQMLYRAVRFAIARQRKVMGFQAAADTDPLTGLPNRRHLQSNFTESLACSVKNGEPMSLALFDLDHFKKVNDAHGHFIGDAVLKQVGFLLSDSLQEGMRAARFGGEEFSVLMPGFSLDQAVGHTETILARFASQPMQFGELEILVTASAGVASVNPDDDWDAAYVGCDVALYEAKKSGRNRLVIRNRSMSQGAEEAV
ncbi:MAG: diguanylate cyclase [Rubripirellula sp.]